MARLEMLASRVGWTVPRTSMALPLEVRSTATVVTDTGSKDGGACSAS